MELSDIHIRDPFVLPLASQGQYYLYGTTAPNVWEGTWVDLLCYRSRDLRQWEGPFTIFQRPEGFWAVKDFWAPEVHFFQGRYYMLASFKGPVGGGRRGTQALVADSPVGPFVPVGNAALTPLDWECLDGTLFVDEAGRPFLVFCHEWVQVRDGQIHAMPLKDDLSAAAGEPVLLFTASQAPWACAYKGDSYVTDGPFLHRLSDGSLVMLWSSFGQSGYAIGCSRSESGSIFGPWTHEKQALFGKDGGHGMVFRTFDGHLVLAIHAPNATPHERPVFMEVLERDGQIVMAGDLK